MHYEGTIYRPPSEAHSLIIQATVGCTHNGCTFCSAHKDKKFRQKPFEIVLADMREARQYYTRVPRIFFADGDVFCLSFDELARLFGAAKEVFPECERIAVYARASQIMSKTDDELVKLRDMGLGILYIGGESGSDEVLRRVKKGETVGQTIEAVQKAERAKIETSVTFILGLGGKELKIEHAISTGRMISSMGASYVAFLSLDLELDSDAPLYYEVQSGAFTLLTPREIIDELETILVHTNCTTETVLRSNHAANWLVLKGTLPRDKSKLLEQIRYAKANTGALFGD